MSKAQYAASAMFFALVALIVLALYGDAQIRALVVYSAVLIAWSQFAGQTQTKLANNASIVAVYLAFLLTLIAATRLLLGVP
ncbi:hypothetical protein OIV19_21510 [Brucella sp. HL-2]|nr:hypothetical protein [Brucella sp. HL-2]MCV9910176.1 hypothetical protein [Brucella sp. HL-2]